MDVDMVVPAPVSMLYTEYYKDYNQKMGYKALSAFNRDMKIGSLLNDFIVNELPSKFSTVTYKEIDITQKLRIFNAGILIFDAAVWRNYKFLEQTLELYKFKAKAKLEQDTDIFAGITQPVMNLLYIMNEV